MLGFYTWEIIAISFTFAIYGLRTHSGVTQSIPPTTLKNKIILWIFDDSYHAVHHARTNYNFGSSSLFDRLYGTYLDPKIAFKDQFKDKVED
jgi:sterol desaturase/sphingolipid hydroxylase (fatty acid hydroxylase superfamily)